MHTSIPLYIQWIADDEIYPKGVFFVIEPIEEIFWIRSADEKGFLVEGELYLVTDPSDLKSHIEEATSKKSNFIYKFYPQ